jgi:type IV secretion system protein VirB4
VRHLAHLRRDLCASEHIPFTAHAAGTVVRTRLGDYLQTIRLGGASFESSDDDQLNTAHERLNVLWRNLASPHVALWTHLIRRQHQDTTNTYATRSISRTPSAFAHELEARYRERLGHETLMVNELYLTILYRPTPTAASHWTLRTLRRTDPAATLAERRDALDACAKLASLTLAALDRYDPELLGAQPSTAHPARHESTLLEFLSLLINAEAQRIPLPRAPLNQALATTRLLFGSETMEYRGTATTRFGAFLGIKEYPTPSTPGAFDALLAAPFPLVLTQSFNFLTKVAGQGLLQRQIHRLRNAGDYATSQTEELSSALDLLSGNAFAMGEHHFSLQVLSDAVPAHDAQASRDALQTLDDRLAAARALLADTGMAIAREDLALEAAYWAQLPGQFALRPRKAPITTRNFAAFVPFHNYPTGRAQGNHWGEALTCLITNARSPFYFSLHAPDPNDRNATDAGAGSTRDTGHTFLCGPTGSGKTVLIGFLIAMLTKHNATQIIFDKDQGLEILIRALGGAYLPLKVGTPTGFNPLTLDATPFNIEFLKSWLHTLVRRAADTPSAHLETLSAREAADLEHALRATLQLDPTVRRLSRLIEFLDSTDPEGLHARLAPWCANTRGDLAWIFDNESDTVVPLLHARTTIGFDVTEFLTHPRARTPITLYLFHLIRQLLDGRRLVCWLDEFWRLLADPAFEHFAKDGPKTWRKLNALMVLATQSASDVLQSPISRTIIEQTPTKIFFPNPEAQRDDYVEGFNLTTREWQLIREQLEPGSRQFLIRQSRHSVVCELNLKGFDAELAVIASRATTLAIAHRLIAECGEEPRHWLPWFKDEVTHHTA